MAAGKDALSSCDRIPASSESESPDRLNASPTTHPRDRLHQIEREVKRELMGHRGLDFSTLTVHRIRDGVCLQGVLQVDEDAPDVSEIARSVGGVQMVLNHLVVHRGRTNSDS